MLSLHVEREIAFHQRYKQNIYLLIKAFVAFLTILNITIFIRINVILKFIGTYTFSKFVYVLIRY